ncbi:MAG TPA: DNA polymerase III subunit chi [Rhodospirillaceae bacterium]|nr:DNA polymerase III subunit chi [Rhodospirillaceae bacterium]
MSPRIGFYHLQRSSLDQALPRLLERALQAGHRIVVMAGSAERVAYLDSLLWTWLPDSWLPHGRADEGDAALQPICLTYQDENPNAADVLMLTDGVVSEQVADFTRCFNLFDGNDPEALQKARTLWKDWQGRGWSLIYYQQGERGGWEEKARTKAPSEGEN